MSSRTSSKRNQASLAPKSARWQKTSKVLLIRASSWFSRHNVAVGRKCRCTQKRQWST